jgi:hypothetical protein
MEILEMSTFEDAINQKEVSVNPRSSEKPRYSNGRMYNVTLGQDRKSLELGCCGYAHERR